jgi:hypothetical protein
MYMSYGIGKTVSPSCRPLQVIGGETLAPRRRPPSLPPHPLAPQMWRLNKSTTQVKGAAGILRISALCGGSREDSAL